MAELSRRVGLGLAARGSVSDVVDLQTAQLHASFGFLLVLGLVLAAATR